MKVTRPRFSDDGFSEALELISKHPDVEYGDTLVDKLVAGECSAGEIIDQLKYPGLLGKCKKAFNAVSDWMTLEHTPQSPEARQREYDFALRAMRASIGCPKPPGRGQ